MSDDEKVVPLRLKTARQRDNDGPMLSVVHTDAFSGGCNHMYRIVNAKTEYAIYTIKDGETEVECGLCGTRLDPMFVLRRLANEETQWIRHREQYLDEMQRLKARERTTCQHCGKMTRISRN